jgi:hypothetical protein
MIFIGVTAAAVVLQLVILAALYASARKTSRRLEALATQVETAGLPIMETTRSLLTELKPKIESVTGKIETISENVSRSTGTVRAQVERLDGTVTEMVNRARLQVIRADELVTRTIDRVEDTTDMVHKTVVSPIRQASALMQGVAVGLETLLGKRRRNSREGVGVPQDEMFI